MTGAGVLGGADVVGAVSSIVLVSTIATPPTANSATTAASPNTNCGNRCHGLAAAASSGPVGGTYCATARVVPVS